MNNKKIGLFIQSLRKEKGITQEALAAMIPIGRQAISKWERGINVPDSSCLLILSDIFDVSINEILYGARENKDNKEEIENISIEIYKYNNSLKRRLKYIGLFILLALLAFLVYFFFNTYSKTVYYKIYENPQGIVESGSFVLTPTKYYFDFNLKKEVVGTVYYETDGEIRLIASGDLTNFHIEENLGYNEYINEDEIDEFLESCYIEYWEEKESKTEKLSLQKDYDNNSLFFKKVSHISHAEKSNQTLEKQNIADKFIYQDGQYSLTIDGITYYYKPELMTIYYKTDSEEVYYYDDIKHLDVRLYQNDTLVCNYSVQDQKLMNILGTCGIENWQSVQKKIKKVIS